MPKNLKTETVPSAYVLRTCDANMRSYGGFQWPESGIVTAPDWKDNTRCGYGLHGFLWGEGDPDLANWGDDAKWLVVRVIGKHIDLAGKVKFESGEVVFVGDRGSAAAEIIRLGARGAVMGAVVTVEADKGTCLAGYRGTATAGYRGTATAGEGGTATAGEGGTILIRYYDRVKCRYRIAEGYVGEEGILPDVIYRATEAGQLERVP